MASDFSQTIEIDLSKNIQGTLLFSSPEFDPWEFDEMVGKRRTLVFVQKTLLGEISRFNCHDIIVWKYQYPNHIEFVSRKWRGMTNTFLTRFVFLHPTSEFYYKRKGLWWGLRGYLEVIICPYPWRGDVVREEVADLLPWFKVVV